MSSLWTLQPTFTQGLILGQLSVLLLLLLILRYLFLDTEPSLPYIRSPIGEEKERSTHQKLASTQHDADIVGGERGPESAEWFNLILYQITQSYRHELRDHIQGFAGDEVARAKIEQWINQHTTSEFMDPIKIHSVDLGTGSPNISNLHFERGETPEDVTIKFDLSYTDTVSISLSTSVLFNYPAPYFARLPISISISLILFSATATLTPPLPTSPSPSLALSLPPTFTLDLKVTSLLGSKAKLADVPKLHEMIQTRIQRAISQHGKLTLVLPGIHAKSAPESAQA